MPFAALLFLQEEGGHAATGAPTSPFEVNFGLFFWTWVVFVTLLFLLWKFAWPGILKATEERENKIKAQLAQAESLNEEAKLALAAGQKLQADTRAEAQSLLAEARAAVEKEKASLVDRVKVEQDALLDRTRREIAAEKDKALLELRREAVDLALGAASKVLGERLDTEADRKVVLDYLASTGKTH